MLGAMVPRRGVHSAETHGQRTRPGTSFPKHRAFSCTDCLWDRLHEPHVPFLQGLRTHVAGVVSSSFSCFSIVARTISLVSYPNTRIQAKLEKFPNSNSCPGPHQSPWNRIILERGQTKRKRTVC